MADGFLGRWSQRKRDVAAGKPVAEPAVARPDALGGEAAPASRTAVAPVPGAAAPAAPAEGPPDAAEPPLPTMNDVRQLTAESDFKPFVARGVAPEVRNAAMKKLFSDPHYNVMDRLDTYIDDYSIPDPMPESMLRQLVSGKFLKLFDEPKEADKDAVTDAGPRDDADVPAGQTVAQSAPTKPDSGSPPPPTELPPPADDANPDLRLQQDHAAGAPGSGRGTA